MNWRFVLVFVFHKLNEISWWPFIVFKRIFNIDTNNCCNTWKRIFKQIQQVFSWLFCLLLYKVNFYILNSPLSQFIQTHQNNLDFVLILFWLFFGPKRPFLFHNCKITVIVIETTIIKKFWQVRVIFCSKTFKRVEVNAVCILLQVLMREFHN